MHSIDRTCAHLAFVDGFGLTRVSAPNKVKTDRSLTGGLVGSLSLTPSESRLHAFVGGFGGRSRGMDFPSLSNAKSLARFAGDFTAIHPDGARHLIFGNWMGYEREARVRVATIVGEHRAVESDTVYDPSALPTLADLTVSDRRPGRHYARLFALSPDGTFAHFTGRDDDTLYVGRISSEDSAPTMLFRVPLAVSQGDVLRLVPGRGGVTIVSYSAAEQRGRVVRVEPDGAVHRIERGCVSMPCDASAGQGAGDVLWQTTPDAVERTSASGLPLKSYAIRDAAKQGPGRVAARGERVWMIPWDGESILDLSDDRVIERKLPDNERALRLFFSKFERRRNEIDAAANLFNRLSHLGTSPKGQRFDWRMECSQGDGSMLAWLCTQQSQLIFDESQVQSIGGFQHASACFGSVFVHQDRVFQGEETAQALAHLRAFDVSALSTMPAVWHLYTDRLGTSFANGRPSPLSPDAEVCWLAAAVATLLQRDPAGASSVTAAEVCLALEAVDGARVQAHGRALVLGIAALSTRVFGAAADLVYAHLIRHTLRVPNAVSYELKQALEWQIRTHPGSRRVIASALDAGPPSGDPEASRWADLRAALG